MQLGVASRIDNKSAWGVQYGGPVQLLFQEVKIHVFLVLEKDQIIVL